MRRGRFQPILRVSIKFEKQEDKLIIKTRWFSPKSPKWGHLQTETRVFLKRLIRESTQDDSVKLWFFHVSSIGFILCQFDCKYFNHLPIFFVGFIILHLDFKLVKICTKQELWRLSGDLILDQATRRHVSSMWGFEIQLCQVASDWLVGRPTH